MDIDSEKLEKWAMASLEKRGRKHLYSAADIRKMAEEARKDLMGLNKPKRSDKNF